MTPWIFAALLLFQAKVDYSHDGKQADRADFTVPVHVQGSHLIYMGPSGSGAPSLRVNVLIEGKKYELERRYAGFLLNPGDYKARILKDKAKLPEELDREYDLLMSDGTFEIFQVVGESE
jgi:hypothetical protein